MVVTYQPFPLTHQHNTRRGGDIPMNHINSNYEGTYEDITGEEMSTEVVGFADPNIDHDDPDVDNKIKLGGKKCGGFGAMGLSFPVIKGIRKRGYKIPTPIQRKTIPLVLEGRDVVAMARTGSGKTACFLVPLFEKLKSPTPKSGARALILSPTRELALQTLKFLKELGRFTGLRPVVVLGGDSMDNQFEAIHGNPDIIVATPGRFLHLCVEMDLKLNSIDYIVFDEADRLFEMGFGEQLHEIVNRLPESRQTLLFSATLPKVLVEFAKAGLSDPVLLRLDVESKLPDHLKLAFVCCRSEEKPAALLCILKHVIKPNAQTVVFAATMHHVDYLRLILDMAGISNTFIYSNLDPSARKINSAKFQMRKVSVLIVTDVAARGIDIPQLDNVINYNFPAKSKLFVHRVGRCARAGRSGTAFSLIAGDEGSYLLDLHLFLGRPFNIKAPVASAVPGEFPDGVIGQIPRTLIEEEHGVIMSWHETRNDIANMRQVCSNAYKQYMRSRPGASVESVKRVREMDLTNLAIHPAFTSGGKLVKEKLEMLDKMKAYRPPGTVFEIGQSTSSTVYTVMKIARQKHHGAILNHGKKLEERENGNLSLPKVLLPMSNADDITSTFPDVVTSKKRKFVQVDMSKRKKKRSTVDLDHYIPYTAPDHHTEQGLAINNFQQEATKNALDLNGDTQETLKLHRKTSRWDPKKKKMVAINQDPKSRKIRTESGVWIPATYKTNRYAEWKERTKVTEEQDEDESDNAPQNMGFHKFPNTHWGQHNKKVQLKAKSELKRPEQILKARIIQERKKKKQAKKKSKSKKSRRK